MPVPNVLDDAIAARVAAPLVAQVCFSHAMCSPPARRIAAATDILGAVGGWGEVPRSLPLLTLARTPVSLACSSVLRRYVDPSGLPTPLLPADPGEPDSETRTCPPAT